MHVSKLWGVVREISDEFSPADTENPRFNGFPSGTDISFADISGTVSV